MDRRSFLRGTLALGGTLAVAPVAAKILIPPELPIIWGDGIHDDAPGLQALFDGKPFVTFDEIAGGTRFGVTQDVLADSVFSRLHQGFFLLKDRVIIGRSKVNYSSISNCEFIFDTEDRERYYVHSKQGHNGFVLGDYVDAPYNFPPSLVIEKDSSGTIMNCVFRSTSRKRGNVGIYQEFGDPDYRNVSFHNLSIGYGKATLS
jgi:hypothetical protein